MASLVIGYGKVGQALAKIISETDSNTWVQDPAKKMFAPDQQYDVMHICYPFDRQFINGVNSYIKSFKPKLTIIHSTVEVGTTSRIFGRVAYSYVTGQHNELETMRLYPRHVGANGLDILIEAAAYLNKCGFKVTKCYNNPETVELQKLINTTYYGICIATTKMFKQMSDHYGLSWSEVAEGSRDYNLGVLAAGHPEWVRPELEPRDGPIGGTCVVPNARILKKTFTHSLLDSVEEAGNRLRTVED